MIFSRFIQFFKISAVALVAAFTLQFAMVNPVQAGGGYKDGYYGGSSHTYPFAVFSGAEVSEDARDSYVGLLLAMNGDLDRSGFLLRFLGYSGGYEYNGPGGLTDGDTLQGDILFGYHWVRGRMDAAFFAGVDFADYDLTPDDLTNPVRGDEVGFKVAVDIDTNSSAAAPLYFALRGSYSTAFDAYYGILRVGHDFGKVTIGPEVWAIGDESGDAQRVGGFLAIDLNLGGGTVGQLSFSAGYQFVDDDNAACGCSFGEEGGYATVKIWTAFARPGSLQPLK